MSYSVMYARRALATISLLLALASPASAQSGCGGQFGPGKFCGNPGGSTGLPGPTTVPAGSLTPIAPYTVLANPTGSTAPPVAISNPILNVVQPTATIGYPTFAGYSSGSYSPGGSSISNFTYGIAAQSVFTGTTANGATPITGQVIHTSTSDIIAQVGALYGGAYSEIAGSVDYGALGIVYNTNHSNINGIGVYGIMRGYGNSTGAFDKELVAMSLGSELDGTGHPTAYALTYNTSTTNAPYNGFIMTSAVTYGYRVGNSHGSNPNEITPTYPFAFLNPNSASPAHLWWIDSSGNDSAVSFVASASSGNAYSSTGFSIDHFGNVYGIALSATPSSGNAVINSNAHTTGDSANYAFSHGGVAKWYLDSAATTFTFALTDQVLGKNVWSSVSNSGIVDFGVGGSLAGQITLAGASSGKVLQTAQAAAGTPTITWGTSSGTPAVTASSPMAITAATGNITCSTCVTTAGGQSIAGLTVTSSFTATGLVTNADLVTTSTNTVKGNASGGTTSPTDLAMPSCGTGSSALTWVNNNGFNCNATVLVAGNALTGTVLAAGIVTSSLTTVGTIGTGAWQGTAIAGAYGGTGLTTAAVGDLIYASATTPTWSRLADVATGSVLVSGGVNTAPAWATNFSAGTITASLTGHASLDCALTGCIIASISDTTPPTNPGILQIGGTVGSTLATTAGIELQIANDYGAKIVQISSGGAQLLFGLRNASVSWTEVMRLTPGYGVNIGGTSDPGAGGLIAAGATIKFTALANASANEIVCYASATGLLTYEPSVATCVPSDPALKIKGPDLMPNVALAKLETLDPGTGRFKPDANLGDNEQVWLYADQVCAMDARLCIKDKQGVLNYDKVGMLAYAISAIKELKRDNDNDKACLNDWKCRLFGVRR